MSAIKGTVVTLTCNGVTVAMQQGLTLSIDCDLPNATNKESGDWAEFITGIMNAGINFNALYGTGLLTDTPAVLSGKGLIDYIINATDVYVSILGGPFPIVGKALKQSISLSADAGQPMKLTGTLKINGKLYPLTGDMANLITDPAVLNDYDTLTKDGLKITSAIKSTAGDKSMFSNGLNVVNATNYRLITFLTLNSGAAPKAKLVTSGDANLSNEVTLTAGINIHTLLSTGDDAAGCLKFINTSNGNWSTFHIYLFKA